MIAGESMPVIHSGAPALAAIDEMDEKNLGFVFITDDERHLLGIITDEDLRRHTRRGVSFTAAVVDELMTRSPKTSIPTRLWRTP